MIESVNHIIVCKPYKGARGLKAKISSGVAVVQQKTEVIGLEVLRDAKINENTVVKKGSMVYIKEEILYAHKDTYSVELTCEDIGEPFILAHYAHVAFIKGKNG